MDSLVAVKLIQAKEVDRSIYASLIKEIRYLGLFVNLVLLLSIIAKIKLVIA
jgi:hypothetical protein